MSVIYKHFFHKQWVIMKEIIRVFIVSNELSIRFFYERRQIRAFPCRNL